MSLNKFKIKDSSSLIIVYDRLRSVLLKKRLVSSANIIYLTNLKTLTLQLWQADKSAQKILSNWPRGPLSTIVARQANKSAELILLSRQVRPLNWPRDCRPLKDKSLCLSLLGLVHKSRSLISWFSALEKCIYTYHVLGQSFNSHPRTHECQRKKSVSNGKD